MTDAIATLKIYIHNYYKQGFKTSYLLAVMLMLAIIISINYTGIFPLLKNWPKTFTSNYLLYFLPFAIAWWLQWFYFKENRILFIKKWFWVLLFAAPLIFTFRLHFNFHENYLKQWAAKDFKYIAAVVNYILRVVVLIVPVIFIWLIKDKRHYSLYGVSTQKNM
ncbi:MAG: hypothetical protein EOP53_22435, partial [Sphingobacteriales bacterium]